MLSSFRGGNEVQGEEGYDRCPRGEEGFFFERGVSRRMCKRIKF